MDLLDLYHAHDHSLALGDTYDEPEEPTPAPLPKKAIKKVKEAKFLPWEPYKAAPSHDRKGEAPKEVPQLIPYTTPSISSKNESPIPDLPQINNLKLKKTQNNNDIPAVDSTDDKLEKEVAQLHAELEAERNVNRELKSIFLKSLGDDFQCEVEALAVDKVQLSRSIEDYCEKVVSLTQQLEDSRIEADVWKCKFQAQSIRCDDISRRLNTAAALLHQGQDVLKKLGHSRDDLPEELHRLASLDIPSLLERSPCDPRVRRKAPNFSNITVTCCKNCTGREIVLL